MILIHINTIVIPCILKLLYMYIVCVITCSTNALNFKCTHTISVHFLNAGRNPFVQWFFIGVAGISAIFYALIFLVTTANVYWSLRKKQRELASLTPAAQQRFQGLFFRLKFFIVVTVVVAMCSIATVVLPTEIMLHQWQHGKNEYSFYSM